MEMVAASKMRKAQERMHAARPYAEKIRDVAGHLSHANPEYNHPFLVTRDEVKRVGYIIISSDRGLCGGLNTNMLKAAVADMKKWHEKGVGVEFCSIGSNPNSFMFLLSTDRSIIEYPNPACVALINASALFALNRPFIAYFSILSCPQAAISNLSKVKELLL